MNLDTTEQTNTWGLLGPEVIQSTRRTRTLGLGAAIRTFNDLAVPGLGGVWFCKQILLSTLGIVVAHAARASGNNVRNIETANAIEALACWTGFEQNGWQIDARLRGSTKLRDKRERIAKFSNARQRNFYVVQPMRMSTVQVLPALGLIEAQGSRFNTFVPTTLGEEFVEQAGKGHKPYKKSIVGYLSQWIESDHVNLNNSPLTKLLSPTTSMHVNGRKFILERLIQGTGLDEDVDLNQRRRNALEWTQQIRTGSYVTAATSNQPSCIKTEHWEDINAGAKFFLVRDAALASLDTLESYLGNKSSKSFSLASKLPGPVASKIEDLSNSAQVFLDSTDEARYLDARAFCEECIKNNQPDVMRALVRRDDRVLRLMGNEVKPGPAFSGAQYQQDNPEELDTPEGNDIPLPKGLSYRLSNLYLLNLDLHDELEAWLHPPTQTTQT